MKQLKFNHGGLNAVFYFFSISIIISMVYALFTWDIVPLLIVFIATVLEFLGIAVLKGADDNEGEYKNKYKEAREQRLKAIDEIDQKERDLIDQALAEARSLDYTDRTIL